MVCSLAWSMACLLLAVPHRIRAHYTVLHRTVPYCTANGRVPCTTTCATIIMMMRYTLHVCMRVGPCKCHVRPHIWQVRDCHCASGVSYNCQVSAPTGCSATCGSAGVRTTTRTCISSAGAAAQAYLCGNCETSITPCQSVPACASAHILACRWLVVVCSHECMHACILERVRICTHA